MIELFFDVLTWIVGTVVWVIAMIFCMGNMLGGHNGWYQLGGFMGFILVLTAGVIAFVLGMPA